MGGDQGLDLGDDVAMTSPGELGRDQHLSADEPELLQTGRVGHCRVDVGQVDPRGSAPERQRIAQGRRRLLRPAETERLLALPEQLFELVRVDQQRRP